MNIMDHHGKEFHVNQRIHPRSLENATPLAAACKQEAHPPSFWSWKNTPATLFARRTFQFHGGLEWHNLGHEKFQSICSGKSSIHRTCRKMGMPCHFFKDRCSLKHRLVPGVKQNPPPRQRRGRQESTFEHPGIPSISEHT